LVLVTDGFFEWTNPDDELFGVERITTLLHRYRDEPPRRIIERLHEAVRAFGRGTPQTDDLTIIIVKRL